MNIACFHPGSRTKSDASKQVTTYLQVCSFVRMRDNLKATKSISWFEKQKKKPSGSSTSFFSARSSWRFRPSSVSAGEALSKSSCSCRKASCWAGSSLANFSSFLVISWGIRFEGKLTSGNSLANHSATWKHTSWNVYSFCFQNYTFCAGKLYLRNMNRQSKGEKMHTQSCLILG